MKKVRRRSRQHASFEQLATCWPLTRECGVLQFGWPKHFSTGLYAVHFPSHFPLGNRKRRRAIKIFATMKSYLCACVCRVPCVPRPHLGKRSEGKVESKGKGSKVGVGGRGKQRELGVVK